MVAVVATVNFDFLLCTHVLDCAKVKCCSWLCPADCLQADLHRKRKQLVIETGPLPDETADSSSAYSSSSSSSSRPGRGRARAAAEKQKQQGQQQQQDKEQWDGQSLKDLVK